MWEYVAVSLEWDRARRSYGAAPAGGEMIYGVGNVLKHYGRQGWELVSFTPNRWSVPPDSGTEMREAFVLIYYAVFKRALAAAPAAPDTAGAAG